MNLFMNAAVPLQKIYLSVQVLKNIPILETTKEIFAPQYFTSLVSMRFKGFDAITRRNYFNSSRFSWILCCW